MFIMIRLSGLCNQKNNVQFQGGMVGKGSSNNFGRSVMETHVPSPPWWPAEPGSGKEVGDDVVGGFQSPDSCVCVCVLYFHVCPPFQNNKERRLGDPREMHRMKTFKCMEIFMRLGWRWWEPERWLGGVYIQDGQDSLCVFCQPLGKDACLTAIGAPNPTVRRPRRFWFHPQGLLGLACCVKAMGRIKICNKTQRFLPSLPASPFSLLTPRLTWRRRAIPKGL